MSLYDAFKDALNVAQKADNIELYRQLLDLSAQALDLQAEITRLKEENAELRKKRDLSNSLTRHIESFITKTDEALDLRYCSHCWDADEKLVQLSCDEDDGTFVCPHCKMKGIYDVQLYNDWQKRQSEEYSNLANIL